MKGDAKAMATDFLVKLEGFVQNVCELSIEDLRAGIVAIRAYDREQAARFAELEREQREARSLLGKALIENSRLRLELETAPRAHAAIIDGRIVAVAQREDYVEYLRKTHGDEVKEVAIVAIEER